MKSFRISTTGRPLRAPLRDSASQPSASTWMLLKWIAPCLFFDPTWVRQARSTFFRNQCRVPTWTWKILLFTDARHFRIPLNTSSLEANILCPAQLTLDLTEFYSSEWTLWYLYYTLHPILSVIIHNAILHYSKTCMHMSFFYDALRRPLHKGRGVCSCVSPSHAW